MPNALLVCLLRRTLPCSEAAWPLFCNTFWAQVITTECSPYFSWQTLGECRTGRAGAPFHALERTFPLVSVATVLPCRKQALPAPCQPACLPSTAAATDR